MKNKLWLVIAAVAFATLACSISIPITQVKTGPSETTRITVNEPFNPSEETEILIAFGAGKLTLSPGAEDALVDGVATYNVEDFEPTVETRNGYVKIEQGALNLTGIPSFQGGIENDWDLALGSTPIKLRINAGAYEGQYELGGLALTNLQITDGAADVSLAFSEPNRATMEELLYETGASSVSMEGLANANFREMILRSGAGDYQLDFSGQLLQDASVTIESGVSSVEIIVPKGVNAVLRFEGALTNIDADGDWREENGEYVQNGAGPTLTIVIKMGAGNLELRNP